MNHSKGKWLACLSLAAVLIATGIVSWQLHSNACPQFAFQSGNWFLTFIAAAGVLLSLTTFFLLRLRERARQTSDAHAIEVAGPLDSKEKQLAGILESIDEVLWSFDFPGWIRQSGG